MKKLLAAIFLFLFLSTSLTKAKTYTIDAIKQDPNEIDAIKKMLTTQQICWNNGDIDGFMLGYWNSEKFEFSWVNRTEYGWENALEKYKISYPTKESMGEFRFELLDVNLTSDTTATSNGKWELIRINDNPKGSFILNFQKIENNWLIIKDYTTNE